MAARKHLEQESIELIHIDNQPLLKSAPGKAVVRLHPQLGFSLDFDSLPTQALPWGKLCRIRTATGVETEGYFQFSLNARFYGPASFVLRKAPHVVMPSDADIKKLEFRIVNFPGFFGKGTTSTTRKGVIYRFDSAMGRFRGFRFDFTERVGRTGTRYRPAHGYVLTHDGVLRRDDRKPFSVAEAGENMRRLRAFLSFAHGMACDLIAVHAYTAKGKATFSWGTSFVEPAKPAAER